MSSSRSSRRGSIGLITAPTPLDITQPASAVVAPVVDSPQRLTSTGRPLRTAAASAAAIRAVADVVDRADDSYSIRAPVVGDKELRVRTGKKSYADLSAKEIALESRRVEKALDLRQRKRVVESEEDDEVDEVEVVEEESKEKHHQHDDDEDGEFEMDPEQEAADEAEEEEAEEEEEAYEEEHPLDRRHLSRSAKAATLDRLQKVLKPQRHDPAPPKKTILDFIIDAITELNANRKPKGFTQQLIKNHLQKQDSSITLVKFKLAWAMGVDERLLYNPGDDQKRWKLYRQNVEKYQAAIEAKHHQQQKAHHSKQVIANKRSHQRRSALPESGDEGEEDEVMITAPAATSKSSFVDPTIALFKQLRDALSPWKSEIEASEAAAMERQRLDRELAAAVFPNSKAHSATSNIDLSGERRSRRQSGLLPSMEVESKQNPPPSSLSSLKFQPTAAASLPPPPPISMRTTRHRSSERKQSEMEEESKEERKSSSATTTPTHSVDEENDVIMTDAPTAATPSADVTAASASSNQVSGQSIPEFHESKSQTPSSEALAPERYLALRGPALLSEYVLFTILRASSHRMSTTQLIESLRRLPHLPRGFLDWAITHPQIIQSDPNAMVVDTDDQEEQKQPTRTTTTFGPSPLEDVLQKLIARSLLDQREGRGNEYRATTFAIENARTAAPAVQLKQSKGAPRNSAQQQHAASLRALKLQLTFAQTAFIEQHKEVFAPFITNAKIRAAHHLPPTLTPRTESDLPPTTKVEYPLWPIPKSIATPELVREYQIQGFSFLAHLHDSGASAILADEMGLGKTLQTICFLAWLKENRGLEGPHLVIVPLNVLDTWVQESHRWCPSLRVVRYHGSEKERQRIYREYLQHGTFDLIVTTYETVVISHSFFRYHFYFCYVIVDEAHRIKNELSLLSIALRHVSCLNKVLLTGTPLQNNLHEMWALLNYLYPQLFPASEPFDKGFDLNHQCINQSVLLAAQALLQPIMIRRLKKQVATKLPIKTETQIKCKLVPYQTHWYKLLLASNAGLLDSLTDEAKKNPDEAILNENVDGDLTAGDSQVLHESAQLDAQGNIVSTQLARIHHDETPTQFSRISPSEEEANFGLGDSVKIAASAGNEWRKLMNLMMQLRKVCCHPYIFPHAEPQDSARDSIIHTSGKMVMLDKLLKKLYQGKHRVLIFTNFLAMMDILARFCEVRKYKYLTLNGGTNRVQRKFDIARYNSSNEFFIYIISTRAGGLGINLVGADTVIHYDSDWNPQVDLQAQDRAHRIGQTRPVRVFRMIMDQTAEERIVARAQRKLYLDAMITSGDAGLQHGDIEKLTKTELLSMLKFGSDNIFSSTDEVDDRDIDVILSGATTTVMTDDALERDAKKVLASSKLDCANFDTKISDLTINQFAGMTIPKMNNYRSIADSWTDLDKHGRSRQSTTIMIGRDAVMRNNNYSWDSDLGRAMESRDIRQYNVLYKPWLENESWCLVCHEGGEVLLCDFCPRSYHESCLPGGSIDNYMNINRFRCPQHFCRECNRGSADAGGLLFQCCCCTTAWCEDHASKDMIPKRNDPQLVKLGWMDRSNSFYMICGEKACIQYYDEWIKPLEPKGHSDETNSTDSSSLNDLLQTSAPDDDDTKMVDEDEEKANGMHTPRKSPRKPMPRFSPPPATSTSTATNAAAATAAPAVPLNSAYSQLSDRLRGRLKKLIQRESDSAAQGIRRNALGEIPAISHTFQYMDERSTMLHALHHMLFGEESNIQSEARRHIMEWTGLPVNATKYDAGEFYARCADEFSGWKTKSIEELSKVFHLTTVTPPRLITSGPSAGKMSHTEPRSFTIGKGDIRDETGLRGDPEECVIEHIICFLMAPRPHVMELRFEYMAKSVLKDRVWKEEMRIAQETGIPRAPKPKKPKPVIAAPVSSSSNASALVTPKKKSTQSSTTDMSPTTSAHKPKPKTSSTPIVIDATSSDDEAKKKAKKDKKEKKEKKHEQTHKRPRSPSPTSDAEMDDEIKKILAFSHKKKDDTTKPPHKKHKHSHHEADGSEVKVKKHKHSHHDADREEKSKKHKKHHHHHHDHEHKKEKKSTSTAPSTTSSSTPSASATTSTTTPIGTVKRTVTCRNCGVEGHMAKTCTAPGSTDSDTEMAEAIKESLKEKMKSTQASANLPAAGHQPSTTKLHEIEVIEIE